jgi:Polyketide cyclase / dehydrase and lipid transport
MWTATASIATIASPRTLWRLFEDVAGWTNWNAGIERIVLHGPFAAGSTFEMQAPGMDAFTSTLRDVRPDAGFVDETILDGTHFLVSHELQPLSAGGTRVTYAIRVEGPEAATLGPLVTADFPEVLAALKALAEQAEHACEGEP